MQETKSIYLYAEYNCPIEPVYYLPNKKNKKNCYTIDCILSLNWFTGNGEGQDSIEYRAVRLLRK